MGHRGDEGISFGGRPCLPELSHRCHGGGIRVANLRGQRLGTLWAHAGVAGTAPSHDRNKPFASPPSIPCGSSALQLQGHQIRHYSCLARHGSPKLMLFHPILRDALLFPGLPHPRAVVCLCPLQVLTEAAVSPRLPLASCLSVRLSLRTERLQEASFLPPPLLASTHAHPAAGCPPAPAAAATRGRVPPPCAL